MLIIMCITAVHLLCTRVHIVYCSLTNCYLLCTHITCTISSPAVKRITPVHSTHGTRGQRPEHVEQFDKNSSGNSFSNSLSSVFFIRSTVSRITGTKDEEMTWVMMMYLDAYTFFMMTLVIRS